MSFKRIGHKIMAVVGVTVTIGLLLTALFYTGLQEAEVLAQNERTMGRLAESVIQGLHIALLSGDAEVAQGYADRLKTVPSVTDFRLLRVNGSEAFRDNQTILDVNQRRGRSEFLPRESEARVEVLPPSDTHLKQTLSSREPVAFYETDASGARFLTLLAPIPNQPLCHQCHGQSEPVRGVVKLTTSIAPLQTDILRARHQSLIVAGVAVLATLLLTGFMLSRSVSRPIQRVTEAMARVAGGDLERKVPAVGNDEIARMATSFNQMTAELARSYAGLKQEQDKLATLIRAADQGMVVTDGRGVVVLVNPAAEQLLGKSAEEVIRDGFLNLFEAPEDMRRRLDAREREAETITYNQRILSLAVSTIRDARGVPVGSTAMFRDVTAEKGLEEELRRLSNTDPLTGLYNRRYLGEWLEREFERSRRHGLPLSVMMCDVDHFKQFNDHYGHERGDQALQTVARLISEALRMHDLPCRYGGEEFLAILPSTTQSGAYSVAERLRRDIAETQVDGLSVTVSIGVASYPEVAAQSPIALIEAADRALYDAKEAGRNRVRVAPPRSVA